MSTRTLYQSGRRSMSISRPHLQGIRRCSPNLNCQSEVRIFEEKNEKYHGFTLTKGRVLYIDISRFSEPEEAATNEVGTTLTGC